MFGLIDGQINGLWIFDLAGRKEGNILFTVIWRRTYGKGPFR